MSKICIFYSMPDTEKVQRLSSILEQLGWSVWWDKNIKKGRWAAEIENNIKLSNCVITVWNSQAIKSDSITFAEAEKARSLHKPLITLISEHVDLPLPFNSEHITADISTWSGAKDAECVAKIIESIESILGIAPRKWSGERPSQLNLLGKQLKLPCFVKSLSSHETQLDPEAGLAVLNLFPNMDAILVSAYDMYFRESPGITQKEKKKQRKSHNEMLEDLKRLDEQGVFILLDSGNYEKSRKTDNTWTKEKFEATLRNTPYTLAFCYDNLSPANDVIKNVDDVIHRVDGEYSDFLMPILHAPEIENGLRDYSLLPDIFYEYASRKNSPLIAVPERELGEGICKKAHTISKIREQLNKLDRYQPIHILGTGNPLSLLILAAAGADLFDGLEWCRTVADRNSGFLFHHQHFEFFKSQTIQMSQNNIIKEAMLDEGPTQKAKMGLHNLDFFSEWMDELQFFIQSKRVSEMIKGRTRFNAIEFVGEIQQLMPGLLNERNLS